MSELLPLAAVDRILRKANPNARVSEEAAKELRDALEEIGIRIAQQSNTMALHAGRKTITAEDIKLVLKNLKQ